MKQSFSLKDITNIKKWLFRKLLIQVLIVHPTVATDILLSDGVVAVENRSAVLPCTASEEIELAFMTPTLLRWFHYRYHKPIYTLDLRFIDKVNFNSLSSNGLHFPSNDFEGRLYLDLNSHPIALRIDPVLYADHGRYTCRIDFKTHRSRSSVQDLKVIVPPRGVVIQDKTGKKIDRIFGPLLLSEFLNLSCNAIGGHPTASVSWSETKKLNYTRRKSNLPRINGASLIITSLKRYHNWNQFTCKAWNSNLTEPLTTSVTLQIILPPISIRIESNLKKPFRIGQNLQLTCISYGSHPRAHIQWLYAKGSTISTSGDIVKDGGNVTQSHLYRTISIHDDGLEVKCISSNPSIKDSLLQKVFVINVVYKPIVTVSLDNESVYEGSNVTLHCKITANPTAYEIKWNFNGNSIQASESVYQKNAHISISNIERTQTGTYSCVATNNEGSSNSSIYINVKYMPVCREIEISKQHKDSLQDRIVVNVTCNLFSNPQNVTFYWMIRDSSSNHSWSTGFIPHTTVKWKKSNLEMTCWGKNDVGRQKTPCSLQILRATEKETDVDIVLIASFAALSCFITIFIMTRNLHHPNKIHFLIHNEEMKHFTNKQENRVLNDSVVNGDDASAEKLIIDEVQL